jgi:hypothetical protein
MIGIAHADRVFEIEFTPAFDPKSHISIFSNSGMNGLVFRYGDTRTKVEQTQTYTVDEKTAEEFFRHLDEISRRRQGKKHPGTAYDGITIEGTYTRPKVAPFKFKAWAPSKKYLQRDFAIVEALFKVLDTLKPTDSLTEYIETLTNYFDDFPLPVKIIGGSPFEVRFYAALSIRYETELANFITKLPTDTPLLIDMSNFKGMGTLLYPYFQELINKNKDVKWIATGRAKDQLIELGVNQKDIMKPLW